MNYPKRGQMSDDGKYYTHTDGSVHHRAEPEPSTDSCSFCSVEWLEHEGKPCDNCKHVMWIVKGAYVPSDEERAACDMARQAIKRCDRFKRWYDEVEGGILPHGCSLCSELKDRSCPARAYLASHGHQDAWEVK